MNFHKKNQLIEDLIILIMISFLVCAITLSLHQPWKQKSTQEHPAESAP